MSDMSDKELINKYVRKPQSEKPETPSFKAEHTVKSGETLSDLALKYYGSAVKEKWMAIYEANKATIGDNPNIIKPDI